MRILETELCAYSVESVRTAALAGVSRVELCASPADEGISPSPADVAEACRIAASETIGTDGTPRRPLELFVMVRPRGGDFVYTDAEVEGMKRQIAAAKEAGAAGVVFGLLTPEGDVDTSRTRELVALARPMEVTFHRAFDVARDWRHALEDIIAVGCDRILTSGQRATAPEGIETIREIVKAAGGRIEIMAGSGVGPANARALAATGVDALHFSARITLPGGDTVYGDGRFIREMVAIARSLT